jgi:Fe-Mn family superoxide dismutase
MEDIEFGLPPARAHALSWVRLDVRRAAAFAASDCRIEGAPWHDPDRVDEWGPALASSGVRECIVYCVHGHEVGRDTASRLRHFGIQAHYLAGGIEGWKEAGLPLLKKEVSS